MRAVPFEGGPLDGTSVQVRGRPCLCRDAQGRPLPARAADRAINLLNAGLATPQVYAKFGGRGYRWVPQIAAERQDTSRKAPGE